MSSTPISFDLISQDTTAYSDTGSSIEQCSENGINIHVHVDGDNNDVSINFGDISKKGTNSTGSEYYEADDVCDNVKYGTGDYCVTYCYDCENAGAVYDTGSSWYALPFYLKAITLPFVLPFAPMGSMRLGTNQLVVDDVIEHKPQETTTTKEPLETVEEETANVLTQELTDNEKEFLDTVYAISGEEAVYTKEAYDEIMWGGYQEEPIVEEKKEEEPIYDIFSNPENQRFLKTA